MKGPRDVGYAILVAFQVLDDVFTKAAEAAKEEQTALEEQREQLELALMKKAPPRRARTPEEMEDKMGATLSCHPDL